MDKGERQWDLILCFGRVSSLWVCTQLLWRTITDIVNGRKSITKQINIR